MTQPPQKNPPPQPGSSHSGQVPANQSVQRQTKLGARTEKLLMNIWEPIDVLGQRFLGDYWQTLYLTVRDAIALALILKVPGLFGHLVLGKSFSDFTMCLNEKPWGASRYACFIIVLSEFLLWIVIAGRIIGRFLADLSELINRKKGGGHGSKQP